MTHVLSQIKPCGIANAIVSIDTGTLNKGRELHQILTPSGWIKRLRQWTRIVEQRC